MSYSWDFNETLCNDCGGYTINSTYFQLKKYNKIDEFGMYFYNWFCGKVPYKIQYKHEEGHIYTNQLLNVENYVGTSENPLDNFCEFQHDNSNLSITTNDFLTNFCVPVSEGIADYHLKTYFNNSTSDDYFKCIEKIYKQHYQGLRFVEYALDKKLYSNLTDLILDLFSVIQYDYYKEFTNTLPDSLTIY